MPKVVILGQKELDVRPGTNLLQLLKEQRYDDQLPATCGGQGQCSTCAVRVLKGGGDPNQNEKEVLGEEQLAKGWRLSCQISVNQDIEVEVPGYEVAEAIQIEPELVRTVLAYAAEKIPLSELPSTQKITVKRLKDLSNRTESLLEGGGDPNDFEVLYAVFSYIGKDHRAQEIPELTGEKIEKILEAFAKRLPAEEEEIITYPYFLYVAFTVLFFLIAGLGIYSVFRDAPLEEPATPSFTPNPEKAPWYFVGIQELLAISPNIGPLTSVAIGGVIIPALLVLFLMAIPYIEPYLEFWRKDKSKPVGRRLRDRPVTTALFTLVVGAIIVLIIIGQYFRGPQWEWVLPWK
ncbi:MAG: 2Fe-2S iron-sulfur cluster-binding protein [Candidatus Bipolaricaulota bacterium]|nr:2Fe-2S iron-sulfur cluster-binding protein [Candidatus Bipolaricaulota bacterium]MDW8031171.1 2Fe-2S iron-sulfur cluster-binding protein [Candidatus Bipolaricaulota bacterium]